MLNGGTWPPERGDERLFPPMHQIIRNGMPLLWQIAQKPTHLQPLSGNMKKMILPTLLNNSEVIYVMITRMIFKHLFTFLIP